MTQPVFHTYPDTEPVPAPWGDDEQPDDWGPSADQEAAWDAREDDARGHVLAEAYWQPVYDSGAEGPFSPDE